MRGVDDPLTVLTLDALDVPETRKEAAGRYVKQAARAVLDQRPTAARLAHHPIPQHFFGRLRFARRWCGARDGAGRLRRSGDGCGHRGFLLQPFEQFGDAGELRCRFGLATL